MKKIKPLVYVAAYYTANPAHGMREAIEAWNKLMGMGVTPFVPHTSLLLDVVYPHDSKFWYDYDLDILYHCDALFVCSDANTTESTGVTEEIIWAECQGIPVFYTYADLMNWVRSL